VKRIVKEGLKRFAAIFCDEDYALDVYRLVGIAAYVVAIIIALRICDLLPTLDAARLGIGAGLASMVAGLGTTLFGQARRNDAAILGKQPAGAP
jgi:hypothetical protein